MFVDPKHSDPPQVRNWRIHIISILVSFGAMAIGYDTAVIGGTLALPSFQRDFGLDVADQHQRDTLSGNIVSTFQAGTFFGALLAFPMAEKYGRKIGMIVSALVFLVGGILMTASNGMLGLVCIYSTPQLHLPFVIHDLLYRYMLVERLQALASAQHPLSSLCTSLRLLLRQSEVAL